MIDIALLHSYTAKAGEGRYIAKRPRGCMEVWHDSKRYVYDLRGLGVSARECRAFINAAWEGDLIESKLTGRYPSYHIG